jgi:nucleoid-associated protein YgaU
MSGRNDGRNIINNNDEVYRKYFKERNLTSINHYVTANIKYPTASEIASRLTIISHIWRTGDRYCKLAEKHYGDPTFWWLIAWFNQRPLESDNKLGDVINIPLSADEAALLYKIGGKK